MNLSDIVSTADQDQALRVLIYGVHGIGKSSLGTEFKSPIFMRTEDGMKGKQFKGVARMELVTTWEQAKEQLKMLLRDEHDYKTLVVDSIDWLQSMIFEKIAEAQDKEDINDIGYGAGHKKAMGYMQTFLTLCDELRRHRKMTIVFIGHSTVNRVDRPDMEAYDTFGVALHKWVAPLVYQWCDIVLFANYKVRVKSAGEHFGTSKYKGLGNGDRVIYTEERPTQQAKNRFSLPYEIPFKEGQTWSVIRDHLIAENAE